MTNQNRYKTEIMLICDQGHHTSEDIYKKLKKTYSFIGIGSVYRNLNELIEEGKIMKTSGVLDKLIYEKEKSEHGHIYCEKSGNIYDIAISNITFDGLPSNFVLREKNIIFKGHFAMEGDNVCEGSV